MYVCFLHMPTVSTEVLPDDAFWIKTSLASVVFILPELTELITSRTVPPVQPGGLEAANMLRCLD